MISKLFFILYIFFLGLSLYTIHSYPLSPDEAYYYYWSKNFHLWTPDHPPLISWLIKLSTYIYKSELTVRLPSFIIGGFIIPFVLYLILRKVTIKKEIIILGSLYPIWTIFGATSLLIITPDIPLMLGVSLSLYIILAKKRPLWIWLGLSFSISIYSKHTGLLWAFALIFSANLTKGFKLSRIEILKTVALLLFLLFPYWYREAVEGFPGVKLLFSHHILSKNIGKELSSIPILSFFIWGLGQAFLLNPIIAFSFLKELTAPPQDDIEKLLKWSFTLFILPVAFISLFFLPEPNWSAPALFLAFVYVLKTLSGKKQKPPFILKLGISFGISFVSFAYILLYSNSQLSLHIEPLNKIRGWKELSHYNFPKNIKVVTEDYQLFSELYFYTNIKERLLCELREPRSLWLTPYSRFPKSFLYVTKIETPLLYPNCKKSLKDTINLDYKKKSIHSLKLYYIRCN